MTMVETYVHRGRLRLRQWAVDPRIHATIRAVGYFLIGFALSPAALGQRFLPLALGWVCACGGWPAVLSAAGGMLGYRLFWDAGAQPIVWLAAGLIVALLLQRLRAQRVVNEQQKMMEEGTSGSRAACDCISAMSDRYAIHQYEALFVPRKWSVY